MHAKPLTRMLERESTKAAYLLSQIPAYVPVAKLFAEISQKQHSYE